MKRFAQLRGAAGTGTPVLIDPTEVVMLVQDEQLDNPGNYLTHVLCRHGGGTLVVGTAQQVYDKLSDATRLN